MASIHKGHRERLKKRYEHEGLDAFQPHEVMELLLFQTVVRRDVNPIAHDLIDQFGSMRGALEAGEAALSAMSGIGARTAGLLSAIPGFLDCYRAQRLSDGPMITNLKSARAYCRRLVDGAHENRLWLLHVNASGAVLLSESIPLRKVQPREIVERALRGRGRGLLMASWRKSAAIRKADIALCRTLLDLLPMMGVVLMDDIIFDGEKAVSLRVSGYLSVNLEEPLIAALAENEWTDEL